MSQITTGLRRALSSPVIYNAFQNALGARRARRIICQEYIRAAVGDVIVDIGCGTALILDELPKSIKYYGFDLSTDYIASAKLRYNHRGTFTCADIAEMPADSIPPCNIAIAIGILHHLDDQGARALLENVYQRLTPGGRLITLDPAYWTNQSPIARAIISRDRGQNVRTGEAYAAMVSNVFSNTQLSRRDDLNRIPYSHAIMECVK